MRLEQLGLAAALLLAATSGLAQSEASKKAARQLGNEGIDLYEQGKFETASEKLERAYAVVSVPTLGLWSARALAKVGRLVEASERYEAVVRSTLEPGAPAAFKEAQADAEKEHQALQARIPNLEVSVEGATASEVSVRVDGKAIESALIGVAVPANPGKRKVTGTRGSETVTEEVVLKEGATSRVTLKFSDAASGAVAAPPTPAPTTDPAPTSSPPPQDPSTPPGADPGADTPSDGSTQRVLGFVALGVGAVGLGLGTFGFLSAKGTQDDLDAEGCEGTRCPSDLESDVDSYNSARTLSSIGWIVGGVGIAAGVTLLLTAPSSSESASAPRVEGFVGYRSAGIRGAF